MSFDAEDIGRRHPHKCTPETVAHLGVGLDIIRESRASPQLRAATLRLVGDLPGLELLDTESDGIATFRIEYHDQKITKRLTFSIDTSGYLRAEELNSVDGDSRFGIPSNTVEFRSTNGQPQSTTELS